MTKITKEFLEDHVQKMSVIQMSRKYGLSEHTIRHKEREFGIKRNKHKDAQAIIKHLSMVKNTADWSHFHNCDEIGSYYLGLIFADGSLFEPNNNNIPVFSLCLKATDKEILEQFITDNKITNKLHVRKPKVYVDKKGKSFNTSEAVYIHIKNLELISILCSYGMEPGPDYKRKPPTLYYMYDFLRGFLDGDGWIHMSPSRPNKMRQFGLKWCCTYKEMGLKLQNTLISMGYNAKLWPTHGIWTLAVNGEEAERLATNLWDNPQRFLKRKYDRYLEWLEYRKTNQPFAKQQKERNDAFKKRMDEGATMKQLKNEFNIGKTQCYNLIEKLKLSEPEHHNQDG